MKNITINNRTFQYKSMGSFTEFYEGEEEYRYKPNLFSRKTIMDKRPKHIFTIYANSEDVELTKTWWRDEILRKIELNNRLEELKIGELI